MRQSWKSFSCFSTLSRKTMEEFEKYGSIEIYKKGEIIFRAKEELEYVYFQVSGKSMIYNLTHHGKRKILFIFGKEALLNEHVMNNHYASFYCETIEKSKVLKIPASCFIGCMKEDFALVQMVLENQERKIWRLGHQLKNTMGSIYMERKLAAKLWKLSRDFGVKTEDGILIDMSLSVTFLADMMGAPRETTSKTCKMLVDYGLISMNRKKITVVDPERMARFYKTGNI